MSRFERNEASLLLVADDPDVRASVARAIAEGDRLEIAEDETSALELLERFVPDLVLVETTAATRSGLAGRIRDLHPGLALAIVSRAATPDPVAESVFERLPPCHPESIFRVALERILAVQLLAAENRRLHESLALAEKCRALIPCLEPGRVYPVTLDLTLGVVSRERGIAVFHRSSNPLSDAVAFRGLNEAEAQRLREQLLEQKPIAAAAAVSEIEILDRGLHLSLLQGSGISVDRLLAVRLEGAETELGMLFLFEDGKPFTEVEIESVTYVRDCARKALENSERYQQAKERAFIDDVTEVYNSRYLLSATENEIRRAERYQNPLSVVFLDLDRFKLVNDRHGHLVGSQTLRNLSQVLLRCVRDVDTLARYGGDEFTILLVDTDHSTALRIAERIRRTVEEQIFEAGREASLRLTVSLGVASYPEHGSDRTTLLEVADKAMYRAKSQGRNRVCSADELSD